MNCSHNRQLQKNGVCKSCYANAYNATPKGREERRQFYLRHKAKIQEKARNRWRAMHPEIKRVRLADRVKKSLPTRRKRNWYRKKRPSEIRLGQNAYGKFIVPPAPDVRETPKGFCDKDWWKTKPEDIPKRWLINS
jgi:hypothetical protein